MSFVAGPMTAQYGAADLGQIKDLVIEHVPRKRLITGDEHGSSPQDAVYQGMECFVEFTVIEWDAAGVQGAFWPYHATWGTQGAGATNTIGQTDVESTNGQILLLTEVVGTTAESDPNFLTATEAILAEGFPVEMLFAPDLREVPLRFRLYPVADAFFTLT